MKNTIKVLGIIAIVAVIGFSMLACDEEPESDHSTAGRLTITGLSSYNGQKISASSDGNFYVMGSNADNGDSEATVSSGSATLYIWTLYDWQGRTKLKSYTGNDQNVKFNVSVSNATGSVTVNFTNGIGSGAFVAD